MIVRDRSRDRDFCIHYARVLLREVRVRRDPAQRAWCFWLLDCAGRARRQAMNMVRPHVQGTLL